MATFRLCLTSWAKDRCHGAGAQLAIECVPAGQGALETVECAKHG